MVYFYDKAQGRDNNLNLIRMIAASAVLVSHAYPIALGPGAAEPLTAMFGHSLGGLSVYVFFAISGFLIAASFERSSSWVSFLTARALRLAPGLFVSLIVVAFVLGPVLTILPLATYLAAPDTWLFMIRNSTLVSMSYHLPGVFEDNPYTAIVGSIWTLFYEVVCYMGVFVVGVLGVLGRRIWMSVALLVYLAAWFWIEINGVSLPRLSALQNLSLPFAIGTAFYVWRSHLPVSAVLMVLLIGLAWLVRDSVTYDFFMMLALSYAVFWLAYVPGGAVRAYNRIGDYSYGIYIYAFPLQGVAVWLMGDQTPIMNMLLSFPATLLCAIVSWHLVEKPALDAKPAMLSLARRFGLPA